jgi:mono/diheme cytochrome c family protein
MRKRIEVGGVLLLSGLGLAGIGHARGGVRLDLQKKATETEAEKEKLLAVGKKIFVEKCAKCHEERGDKALKTGLPLSQRELSDEEITSAVSGRLKGAPDEDKRAVALYVSSLMKRK